MPKIRHASRTKIVATLGPASSDLTTIQALFEAGVDVLRLNVSHGTQADHAARYATLREMERQLNLLGVNLPLPAPSSKVQHDLHFGVDWIDLSFVQGPEDVENSLLELTYQPFAACRKHLQLSPA